MQIVKNYGFLAGFCGKVADVRFMVGLFYRWKATLDKINGDKFPRSLSNSTDYNNPGKRLLHLFLNRHRGTV
jgi:hypothetical protein